MPPIPGPFPGTQEWLEARKFVAGRVPDIVFGASDSGALLGVSPYVSPLDLYCRKLGLTDDDDNLAMAAGRALEPVVMDAYRKETGCEVETGLPMYFSSSIYPVAATPDGIRPDGILVEAKTTSGMRYKGDTADETEFGLEGTDQVPLEYLAQCQHQMFVMEAGIVEMPVLFDNRKLRIYRIERNETIIKQILDAAAEMADRIRNEDPPEPSYGRLGERALIFASSAGRGITDLDASVEELWIQRCEADAKRKEYEHQVRELTDRCLAAMGDAAIGRMVGLGKQLKRIDVKPCQYTVDRPGYSYIREVKLG